MSTSTAAPPTVVNFTVDGRQLSAPPGTLLIDACKRAGIEIPAFCYYEGYSLQAACRMCLVEVEKMPKLQTACTLPVMEGMIVRSETEQIHKARKGTLEFLLTNHPLDCPVCDKGGECELQDMVFRYGAGESRFTEIKNHEPERQWSPVVFYDPARCILCYRCVRACNEGMGVGALGVTNRGVVSEIAPNMVDHLDCDECGACIDICPVGALTSNTYRYKTRPWEMQHVGTVCTHCSNGCKTTLGVRNDEIVRGNNRDRSGINGEFLCVKGRYGFDVSTNEERVTSPMIRINGKLEAVSWSKALGFVAEKFRSVSTAGGSFGVVAGPHLTNEELFYLQKFTRAGLKTSNLDHARSGDLVTLLDALSGKTDALATSDDCYNTKAALVIGSDLSQQHPFLAFQLRADVRHHKANIYTVTPGPVREAKYSAQSIEVPVGGEFDALRNLTETLKGEQELVILFGDSIKGQRVRDLVEWASGLGIPVKYVCLVDYSNSRGAMDMGVMPNLLPGYEVDPHPGMSLGQMLSHETLDVLWVVGANPLRGKTLASKQAFVVTQTMFLEETSERADVVFPSASAYEKNGTVTNVTGQVQRLKAAVRTMGAKTDLEICGLLAKELGLAVEIGVWSHDVVFKEIHKSVRGYNVPLPILITGGAAATNPVNGRVAVDVRIEDIQSAGDTLFTSGELGRYSKLLTSVPEFPGALYKR
ncbi:MAG: NADH-quinone oxidoreductase subunit NuoG [Acidobacteria bacterium]|nr:NADH-quinone oxidoreductase subunit NuoG [Acidobacteriota bacterium]